MSETGTLAPLLSALRDLMEWLRAGHVQGMVIGGVAASIQGRPRVTRDVDVLVLLDRPDWEEFLAAGSNFGFAARISDPLDFAQRTRVLLSHHEPSGIDIDIAFGVLPFEKEAIEQAQWVDIGGVSVPQSPTRPGRHRICIGCSPSTEYTASAPDSI